MPYSEGTADHNKDEITTLIIDLQLHHSCSITFSTWEITWLKFERRQSAKLFHIFENSIQSEYTKETMNVKCGIEAVFWKGATWLQYQRTEAISYSIDVCTPSGSLTSATRHETRENRWTVKNQPSWNVIHRLMCHQIIHTHMNWISFNGFLFPSRHRPCPTFAPDRKRNRHLNITKSPCYLSMDNGESQRKGKRCCIFDEKIRHTSIPPTLNELSSPFLWHLILFNGSYSIWIVRRWSCKRKLLTKNVYCSFVRWEPVPSSIHLSHWCRLSQWRPRTFETNVAKVEPMSPGVVYLRRWVHSLRF